MTTTTTAITPDHTISRTPRRFSEGVEHAPLALRSRRVGRFSDGQEHNAGLPAATRVGSFGDGQAHAPGDRAAYRVGSFADGLERVADLGLAPRSIRPEVDSEGSRIAA